MKNYIAIHKITNKKKSSRKSTTDTAMQSIDRLESSGLEKIAVKDAILASHVIDKHKSGYSKLPLVNGYLLRVTEGNLIKAKETLGDDYLLVPDIKLSIPKALETKIRGSKPTQNLWPQESGIQAAHDEGITGTDVIVAVLDTGCDADHIQFKDRSGIVDFRYYPPEAPQHPRAVRGFDTHGHGTHVSAIIAGNSVGVAPDVDLMVASVIESEEVTTSLLRIIAAIEWMISRVTDPANQNKPAILNMSLGFTPKSLHKNEEKALNEALRFVLARLLDEYDILPIVAIGNEGPNHYRIPGIYPEVLSVGAVDQHLEVASFSGSGSLKIDDDIYQKPDIFGYGVQIYSAFERNLEGHSKYAEQSGTSMATPYVTGIAALIAQKHGLKGRKLRNYMVKHAKKTPVTPPSPGHGLATYE